MTRIHHKADSISNHFTVGDHVWYVIAGVDGLPPIWIAAVVERVTSSRVGIRPAVGHSRARSVRPGRLTTKLPPPDVTALLCLDGDASTWAHVAGDGQ